MEYLFGFVILLICLWAGPRIAKARGFPWPHGLLWAMIGGPIGLAILANLPRPKDGRGETLSQLRTGQTVRENVVELEQTNTTDDDLALLASNSEIVELRLGGTKVTDAGLQHLKRCTNLQVLDISLTGITDNGIESLLQLSSLRTLWLGGTEITDVGLQQLAALPMLKDIHAVNAGVTQSGVQRLKLTLPKCRVHT